MVYVRKRSNKAKEYEDALAKNIARLRYDPLKFVMFAFNWGEGDLKGHKGPDKWQQDILETFGKELKRTEVKEGGSVRIAVTSGHGVGKSALVAWLVLFYISTRPDCQIVVTANTQTQLASKTWRELAVWHKRSIHKHWFEYTATKFYRAGVDDSRTWFASAIPWSENNSEAFAGTHAKHVLYLFDEASAIADIIWEVSEGAMTTPGAAWICFGNPTKNTGRFRECWRKFKHRWITRQVDSREAKMADQKQIGQWIEDYGEDSDFARVRIKGMFPRASSQQFIPEDLVVEAIERRAEAYEYAPKILAVDVARYGDDRTVYLRRQGTKCWPLEKQLGWSVTQVATRAAQIHKEWESDFIAVDGIGIGAGVVDLLQLWGYPVVDVVASRSPVDTKTYHNLRAEMWGSMKKWLESGDLPDDEALLRDLISPEYAFNQKMQIVLERKEDLKKRVGESPDCADALALTFASPDVVHMLREEPVDDFVFYADEGQNPVTGY